MAQIPTYKSQSGLRSGTGSAQLSVPGGLQQAAAAPANALADLGQTGVNMSVQFYAQQKAIERENLLAANYEKFLIGDENNQGFNLIKADAMARGDTAALNDFKMRSDNYFNQISSNISDDVVKRAFKEKYNNAYSSNFIDVQSQVYQNNIDKGKETLAININNATNQYVNGQNEKAKMEGFSQIEKEIDNNIALGILNPDSKDKVLYAAHEVAYKTDLKQQITTNPNGVIEKIENGLYNNLINAEDLNTIKNTAITAINKNAKNSLANLTTNGDFIQEELEKDIESLELFVAPDMDRVNNLSIKLAAIDQARVAQGKSAKYNDTLEDLQDAVYAHTFLEDIKSGSIKEGLKLIKEMEDEINSSKGGDPNNSLIKAKNKAVDLVKKMKSESLDNNNQLQEDLGNPRLPNVDFFADPIAFQTQIKGDGSGSYKEIIGNNANRMNMQVQYFTKDQLLKINDQLKTANFDTLLNFFANVSSLAGKDSINVFNQFKNLGKDGENEGLAHIGMMIDLNDGELTVEMKSAMNGFFSSKDKNNKAILDKLPNDFKIDINNQYFNSIYDEKLMTGVKDQVIKTAEYIFVEKLIDSKFFNEIANPEFETGNNFDLDPDMEKMYRDSLSEAAGQVNKNGVAHGGFVEHNENNFIIIPDNIPTDTDLTELLEEGLTDKLYNEATFVIRPRVPKPDQLEDSGNIVFADFREIPEAHLQNKSISNWKDLFEDKESIYFSNYEENVGQYYIHFGNPNEPGSQYYTNKQGLPILFDLGGIFEMLNDNKVNVDPYEEQEMEIETQDLLDDILKNIGDSDE